MIIFIHPSFPHLKTIYEPSNKGKPQIYIIIVGLGLGLSTTNDYELFSIIVLGIGCTFGVLRYIF
jgi:hypothetical protein